MQEALWSGIFLEACELQPPLRQDLRAESLSQFGRRSTQCRLPHTSSGALQLLPFLVDKVAGIGWTFFFNVTKLYISRAETDRADCGGKCHGLSTPCICTACPLACHFLTGLGVRGDYPGCVPLALDEERGPGTLG